MKHAHHLGDEGLNTPPLPNEQAEAFTQRLVVTVLSAVILGCVAFTTYSVLRYLSA
jgi:hypothetical protein